MEDEKLFNELNSKVLLLQSRIVQLEGEIKDLNGRLLESRHMIEMFIDRLAEEK
jgi:hypothetical protein